MRKLFLLCLVMLVSGCASLSREECVTGDWHGIGYRDGVQGHVEAYVAEHQQACSEYQIKLDLDAYMIGRDLGLEIYCQADNGYRQGINGASYNYVCPLKYEIAFLARYKQGRERYLQEQRVKQLERELRQLQRDDSDLQDKIRATEARLIADGLSEAERQRLLNELRHYEQQRPENRADYHRLSSELRWEQLKLDRLPLE